MTNSLLLSAAAATMCVFRAIHGCRAPLCISADKAFLAVNFFSVPPGRPGRAGVLWEGGTSGEQSLRTLWQHPVDQ